MTPPPPPPGRSRRAPAASSPDDDVVIDARHVIPRAELSARASRAGGAGGQHVNTSSTRVELLWDPATSRALTDIERARVLEKLAARLDAEGRVRIVASDTRSQKQNRVLAEVRLAELVARALVVPRIRKKTRPTRASTERRLETKKRESQKKQDRRPKHWD
ncbi:MAG: aminoacyl-tRNA hydrolase [Gemmatimonadetes bacterium]|nr:aminoacyl-tRNA hydrolase [Gemmatimonadota bacterium]MCC6770885.1 aminoacyl-tRNA hydrolase [Gemmatimonadaceae bacterium]